MMSGLQTCNAAWLDLMQAILPRPAISAALQAALPEPVPTGLDASSIHSAPLATSALLRLMSCFDGVLTHAPLEGCSASHEAVHELERAIALPQKAMCLLGALLQTRSRPLIRWMLSRGAVSTEPGLSHRLVTLLDVATRCPNGQSRANSVNNTNASCCSGLHVII